MIIAQTLVTQAALRPLIKICSNGRGTVLASATMNQDRLGQVIETHQELDPEHRLARSETVVWPPVLYARDHPRECGTRRGHTVYKVREGLVHRDPALRNAQFP